VTCSSVNFTFILLTFTSVYSLRLSFSSSRSYVDSVADTALINIPTVSLIELQGPLLGMFVFPLGGM
jgi:hypothetical protein